MRIASVDGATVTLNLVDSSAGNSTSPTEIGSLASASLVAHDDGFGAYAYSLYQAPINFVRATVDADNTAIERAVKLQVSCVSGGQTVNSETDIAIARPPMILIHGLWSSSFEAWQGFVPAKPAEFGLWSNLPNNGVLAINYKVPPDDVITSTNPTYSDSVVTHITRNSLGFSYNAPFVLGQMIDDVNAFRKTNSVAVVQADVVGHSMGGDIARAMVGLPNFQNDQNYGAGSIHKLITIGTPHLGTPLATQLLDSDNRCVRSLMALQGSVSLTSVSFQSSPAASGAVADLQPPGLSSNIPFPVAYIAGTSSPGNLQNVGKTNAGRVLAYVCGTLVSNPLALSLNSLQWNSLFGSLSNDGVVPIPSQLNGTTGPAAQLLTIPGVIHSPGIESLGFAPPSEIDTASGIPDWVIDLINEQTMGNEFMH